MKRSTMISWDELRVGLVVALGVATFALASYKLGDAANLFTRRYTLYTFLPDAKGVSKGGSVTIDGVVAGSISRIDFLPVSNDTTRNLKVTLSIDRRLQQQVRADSKATLQPLGLLGDKVLNISSGTPRYNVLRPGDTLRVGTSLDYEQVLAEASFAIHDLVALTHDLKAITGGIVRGDGTMGQLVTNRSLYDELTSTLGHTNTLLSRLENKHGSIGQFIDDPTLYQNLVGMVGAVDSLAATLNSSHGTFGRFLRDDSLYNRLTGVASGADSILHELNTGNGMAARMLRDQKMYDQLVAAVTNLNSILADVKQNPRRYTRGLVKVF
jgi:phospholipid/cholesterol/gamma-HCH transport system substrate-binding protein